MNKYANFFIICLAGSVLFFVQQSRVFEIYGTNPNFLLLFLLLCVFFGRISYAYAASLSVFFIVLIFFLFPFLKMWIFSVLSVFFLALWTKRRMTGNSSTDFFVWVLLGTPIFYVVSEIVLNIYEHGINIADFSFLFHTFFIREVAYNMLWAAALWFFAVKTIRIPRRISQL